MFRYRIKTMFESGKILTTELGVATFQNIIQYFTFLLFLVTKYHDPFGLTTTTRNILEVH